MNKVRCLPIVVVIGQRSREEDLRVIEMIKFFGARVSQRCYASERHPEDFLGELRSGGPSAVVINAGTLAELLMSTGDIEGTIGKLTAFIPLLFVYGWLKDAASAVILPALTRDRVLGLSLISSAQSMTIDCHYLGIESGVAKIKVDGGVCLPSHGFELSHGKGAVDTVIGIDGRPIIVRVPIMKCEIYLSSEGNVACLDTPLGAWPRLSSHLSAILPLALLVREAAGEECWLPFWSFACLTIDDPLLIAEYGYLSYQRLIDEIKKTDVHVCCGFIPWNYRRSQSDVVRLFRDNPGKLSIAYHGCDHTKREFGHHRPELLIRQVATAKERMDIHHRVTGIRCNDVMIFPQHSYSTEAIGALSNAGMLCATTGNVYPVDSEGLLTLRDLMDPAVTRYDGFPVFSRTFANQECEILLYLLLGKPIIIIYHHDSFRKGYAGLGSLAKVIGRICPAVEWVDLEQMATGCCQVRENQKCGIEVRFFSRRFSFKNRFGPETRFRFLKRESAADRIAKVTFNSQKCSWEWDNELLSIPAILEPGAIGNVEICYKSVSDRWVKSRSLAYEVSVWSRRRMCEMRDRYLSRLRKC